MGSARRATPRNLDEAHYRVEVNVAGGRVSGWRSFWKLPEAFERARERQNFWAIAITAAEIGSITGLVVWSLLVLIRNIRKGLVRWRPAMAIGGVAAALALVSELLASDQMLKNYPTAVPLETFQLMQYVSLATVAIFSFIMLAVAVALLTSSFPECLAAWRTSNRRLLGADAAAALVAAVGFGIIVNRFEGFLMDRFHAQALFSIGSPETIASAAPALAALTESFRGALLSCAGAATVVLLVRKLKRWTLPVALLALAAMVPDDARTAQEFALHYVSGAIGRRFCGALVLAIRAQQLPGLRAGVLGDGAAWKHLGLAGHGDSGDADTGMGVGRRGCSGSGLGGAAGSF